MTDLFDKCCRRTAFPWYVWPWCGLQEVFFGQRPFHKGRRNISGLWHESTWCERLNWTFEKTFCCNGGKKMDEHLKKRKKKYWDLKLLFGFRKLRLCSQEFFSFFSAKLFAYSPSYRESSPTKSHIKTSSWPGFTHFYKLLYWLLILLFTLLLLMFYFHFFLVFCYFVQFLILYFFNWLRDLLFYFIYLFISFFCWILI